MKTKKAIRLLIIIAIIPIVVFISMGLNQGVKQISYHLRAEKAIESYRIASPLCFIYFTPPTGTENIDSILGEHDIGENFRVYVAKTRIGNDEDIVVSICKIKQMFNREWIKATGFTSFFHDGKAEIDFNGANYEFMISDETASDSGNNMSAFSIPISDDKVIIMQTQKDNP